MANAKVTLIPLELDKPRNLRLDFNALSTAEELTGKNFLDDETFKNMTARDVRALLFAGLKHEDEKLTLEGVGAMLDPGTVAEVLVQLEVAYAQAMPVAPEGGEGDGPLPMRMADADAAL